MSDVDVRRNLPIHVTWMIGIVIAWVSWSVMRETRLGQDSHAYWNVWQGDWSKTLYTVPPGHIDAYNYSPAFAQIIWPLTQLPWPVFGTLWSIAAVAAFVYLFRPLGWRWVFPLVLCCSPEILGGNVFWCLALILAISTRPDSSPATGALWAGVVLTKITPAIGPIWYGVRREWRPMLWSVLGTLAVVAASAVMVPELWERWFSFLASNENSSEVVGSAILPPLAVRLPVGLAVVAWGAATGKRWTLPLSMVLATPVAGPAAFTILAAIPRLSRET